MATRSWMLGHLLRRCHQVNTSIWTSTFGPTLTAPQYAVLSVVAVARDSDMQTVGAVAALDKSTMTGVVRRLEGNGWLRRTRNPRDLRRYALELTPSAELALARTTALVLAARTTFLAPLPARSRDRLMGHLRQLARVDGLPPADGEIGLARDGLLASPGHLLRRAQQAHTAEWSAEFGQELTGPQFAVLRMLRPADGIAQSRLGELVALDKATLSGVLDRLARRGLVASTPDPADRRGRIVGLTEAGGALVRAARPRAELVQARTAAPVPTGDRAWVTDMLERLAFRA